MKGSPALSQKRRTSMPHYSFVKELRAPVPYSRPEHPSSMNNRLTEKAGLRLIAEPSLNQDQPHPVGFAEPITGRGLTAAHAKQMRTAHHRTPVTTEPTVCSTTIYKNKHSE